jgi:hypothetical protein
VITAGSGTRSISVIETLAQLRLVIAMFQPTTVAY